MAAAYFMVRKGKWLIGVAVSVAAVTALIGEMTASLPAADASGGGDIPMWRMLGMSSALLAVSTLNQPLGELEDAAGQAWHRVRGLVLAAVFLGSSLLFLAGAWIAAGSEIVPLVARAQFGWLGIALLSGRILGQRLAWAGPCLFLAIAVYWGYATDSGPRWWEFTALPPGNSAGAFTAFGIFVAGVAAFIATPWRTKRLRSLLFFRSW